MSYTIRKYNNRDRTLAREGFLSKIKEFFTGKKEDDKNDDKVKVLVKTFLNESWLSKQTLPSEPFRFKGLENLLIDNPSKPLDVAIIEDYKKVMSFIDLYIREYSSYKDLIDSEYDKAARQAEAIYKDPSKEETREDLLTDIFNGLEKRLDKACPKKKVFGNGVKFFGGVTIKPLDKPVKGDWFEKTTSEISDEVKPLDKDQLARLAKHLVDERPRLEIARKKMLEALPGIYYDDDAPGVELWWDDSSHINFFQKYYHQRFWDNAIDPLMESFYDWYVDILLKLLDKHAKIL